MSQNNNNPPSKPNEDWRAAAALDTDDWRGHTTRQQRQATGYPSTTGNKTLPTPHNG